MRDGAYALYGRNSPELLPEGSLIEDMVFRHVSTVLISCCVALVFCGAGCSAEKGGQLSMSLDLLPSDAEIPNWSKSGEPKVFIGTKLSEYIDGGSELYFAYNFERAFVQQYKSESQAVITVELYKMDRPENAYGVYSFDTMGEHPDIGQGATYGYGLLQFWKDRFFVRVLSVSEEVDLRDDILGFGNRVASKIESEGSKPDIISRIEHIGIVPESLHYFHKNVVLNNLYYVSDENILNLSEKTEAITFQHDHGGRIIRIIRAILIEYPDPGEAQTAYARFAQSYFHDTVDKYPDLTVTPLIVEKVENDEFSGVKRSGAFLAFVFEAGSEEGCRNILDLVCERLN